MTNDRGQMAGNETVTKFILSGCNGYMGKVVTGLAGDDPEITIVAGVDINTVKLSDYSVYADHGDIIEQADVILDFSIPAALESMLKFAKSKKLPLVLCATGYSPEQIEEIEKASEDIPVFRSGNMSLGINLLIDLIKRACIVLGEDFDIEIVERHHKRKVDAPSGTALMLADAAASILPYDAEYIYERKSTRKPRSKQEIGISAVRGGTIVGVHDVIFAGLDEMIELRHTAASRDVFAVGAIKAVKYIKDKPCGMYNMSDLL